MAITACLAKFVSRSISVAKERTSWSSDQSTPIDLIVPHHRDDQGSSVRHGQVPRAQIPARGTFGVRGEYCVHLRHNDLLRAMAALTALVDEWAGLEVDPGRVERRWPVKPRMSNASPSPGGAASEVRRRILA